MIMAAAKVEGDRKRSIKAEEGRRFYAVTAKPPLTATLYAKAVARHAVALRRITTVAAQEFPPGQRILVHGKPGTVDKLQGLTVCYLPDGATRHAFVNAFDPGVQKLL